MALFFWVLAIYHIHKPLSKLTQNNQSIEINKCFEFTALCIQNWRIRGSLKIWERKKKVTSSSISLIFCIIVDMVAVTGERERERAHGGSVECKSLNASERQREHRNESRRRHSRVFVFSTHLPDYLRQWAVSPMCLELGLIQHHPLGPNKFHQ